MSSKPYADVALKLIPLGAKPSIVELRADIAAAIDDAVNAALRNQREQQYPELGQARRAQEILSKELRDRYDTLQEAERQYVEKVRKLCELEAAWASYFAWQECEDGDELELRDRYARLRKAWLAYRGKNGA